MDTQNKIELVKVASSTNFHKLKTSIVGFIKSGKQVIISTMGDDSLGQATKALISASDTLRDEAKLDIAWKSSWTTIKGKQDGKDLSSIHTRVIILGVINE